jgi:hypothetical protein
LECSQKEGPRHYLLDPITKVDAIEFFAFVSGSSSQISFEANKMGRPVVFSLALFLQRTGSPGIISNSPSKLIV